MKTKGKNKIEIIVKNQEVSIKDKKREYGICQKKFKDVENYLINIYKWEAKGAHNSSIEIRGDLGTNMKKLFKMSLDDSGLDSCLDVIRKCRGSNLSLNKWKKQYNTYLILIARRQELIERSNRVKKWYNKGLENVSNLDESNWNLWGSVRQLKFGKVVTDALRNVGIKLDPVFGALLSPTGGIVGPGNTDLYNGNYLDNIVMHGIIHDAGGYLFNYHNKLGPGYNYINTMFTLFKTSNPLSTQISGIRYWRKLIKRISISET